MLKGVLFLLLAGFAMMVAGEEVEIIKNPDPNCVESNFTELVQCGQVVGPRL